MFLIVDLILLGGSVIAIVMVFRAKRSGRKLGERMSKALQPRPASLPTGGGLMNTARQLAQPALQLRQNAKLRQSLAPAYAGGSLAHTGRPSSSARPGSSTPGAVATPRPGAVRTAGKAAWSVGKIGLASTVGAPVYAPRAAAAAKKMATARKVAMAARLQARGAAVTSRATKAHQDATAFGHEYVHNVATAGRAVGRATGIPRILQAADPGRPAPMNGPSAAAARPGTSPAGDSVEPGRAAPRELKQVPLHLPTPATGRKKPPPPPAAVAYTASDRAAGPARPSRATDTPAPPLPPEPPSPVSYPQSGADRLRARLRQR